MFLITFYFINSYNNKLKWHLGIANPNITFDIISYTCHGTKENFQQNINLPVDIATPKKVSTPSLLNNSPSECLQNTKTFSSDKSHIAKIENYIEQKFDQAVLNHPKSHVLMEIKNELDKNNTNIKKWNPESSEQRLRPCKRA